MENYLKEIQTGADTDRLDALKRELSNFWSAKRYAELFLMILAADLEKYQLKHFDIICVLVRATSKRLSNVEQEWIAV